MRNKVELIIYIVIKRFNMRCKIVDNRKEGQQKIISKYLYFPKRIGDERRWLERCKIKQTLHYMFDVTCGGSQNN